MEEDKKEARPEVPIMPDEIILQIVYRPKEGQLHVNGPIQNRILSYGMLMLAMDVVRNPRGEPQITLVPSMPGLGKFPFGQKR